MIVILLYLQIFSNYEEFKYKGQFKIIHKKS